MPTKTLHRILRAAAPQLLAISDEAFSHQTAPGRWSKKQILGHLIDSAYNNHQRFMRAPHQDHLRFEGYDQEEWVRRNAYQDREKKEVIETFLAVQAHLAQAIATLPEEILSRPVSDHDFHRMAMRAFPEGEPATLGFLIEDYLFHLVHHLRQILPGFDEDWFVGYQRSADKFRLG